MTRLEAAEKADSQMAGNVRALNLIPSLVLGSPALDGKALLEGLLTHLNCRRVACSSKSSEE